jgi:hypothetical protein
MKLHEFLAEHFDDYIYLHKSNGEHITDTAVKFIPLWILKYYGHCDVCVEIEPLSITKYQIFKVYLKMTTLALKNRRITKKNDSE